MSSCGSVEKRLFKDPDPKAYISTAFFFFFSYRFYRCWREMSLSHKEHKESALSQGTEWTLE